MQGRTVSGKIHTADSARDALKRDKEATALLYCFDIMFGLYR